LLSLPNLGIKSVEIGLQRASGAISVRAPNRSNLRWSNARLSWPVTIRRGLIVTRFGLWVADDADFSSPAHGSYTRSRCCQIFPRVANYN
jgi:hypothetical protein